MTFLSEQVANNLQRIAVLFEFLGLSLTFIEVKYPAHADSIERTIDSWTRRFFGWSDQLDPRGNLFPNSPVPGCLAAFAVGFIPLGFLLFERFLPAEVRFYVGWGIALVYVPIFAPFFVLYYLGTTLKQLDEWSNGRALGSLGVFLAFVGFTMEIYQVLTLHKHWVAGLNIWLRVKYGWSIF